MKKFIIISIILVSAVISHAGINLDNQYQSLIKQKDRLDKTHEKLLTSYEKDAAKGKIFSKEKLENLIERKTARDRFCDHMKNGDKEKAKNVYIYFKLLERERSVIQLIQNINTDKTNNEDAGYDSVSVDFDKILEKLKSLHQDVVTAKEKIKSTL